MCRALSIVLATAVTGLAIGCGDEGETTTAASGSDTTTPPEEMTEPESMSEEAKGEKEEKFTVKQVGPSQYAASLGDDPEAALEAFFVSGDPDLVCGELATDELLSSAYGDEEGCRAAQVPAATPKAIEIERLDVSGGEAQATVIPEGGPNDGIETKVTLVNDGGWRVDSLEADIPAGP